MFFLSKPISSRSLARSLRVVRSALELLNVSVLVVLIADQERAARLRLGLSGRQPERKNQAREEDGKGSYSHGKLPSPAMRAPHEFAS